MNYDKIIGGCKNEESRAQMSFYALFSHDVYVVAYRLLENSFDAEEVMQETMLKVLTDTALLLPDAESMCRRLKRIAINSSIDILRKDNRYTDWVEDLEFEEDDCFEEAVMYNERLSLLHKAVEELSPGYRSVVVLHIIEEMSYEEVAQLLKITPSAVRSQFSRAKRRIIEWFENYEKGRRT